MKSKTLTFLFFQVLIVFSALSQKSYQNHYIGEKYGGGIVFHLWVDTLGKQHGLVVYPKNNISGYFENNGKRYATDRFYWSNVQNKRVNSSKMSSNGLENSNQIVTQRGHQQSASQVCLDFNYGGYSDWYLPSVDELLILYNVKNTIYYSMYDYFGGIDYQYVGVPSDCTGTPKGENTDYITSTEYNESQAYGFDFYLGKVNLIEKSSFRYIRPIRSF